ncbi:N-acetylmuramoyl-L-alanine amidase family protein [Brevibacillus laterosporus]|uniref:N-acetylmuramoyl-L-alanine amidase family protein n=1 Tax=Brevibacillus laterosporus TaxID=1465 RepID=UPI000362FDF1|nr:N-acetylmuramoyl-L-alanine amidase [Brevibacillus laterosporus]ATO49425.1 N-acetylmuramoyl-L-alanine amidase [Brevibacillus laterosporus DSM 25]AYB40476.1 N-acetylmuramoyl-L-alanine amidase [Brevibacillus laterosporus]MBG9800696.1 N-acetylmuramoyl-L-alanine amidase [Brevibacillus laterosporus]MBM7110126.1 N-acetylmuramoyl-L-alanine amidase LytC precursor [Brevibacillus laterosporus]MED2004497.1 N-acetylmuramoyl-L-alanine amidase [Brevibacillus laterosporus]
MRWLKAALIGLLLVGLLPTHARAISSEHMPIEIIIDAGHGGIDGGTSYQGILEKDINLQIAKLLYKELMLKGYQVLLNRTGDYALSDENKWLRSPSRHIRDLAQRRHLAKEVRPQMLISLHVNWSNSKSSRGPLVLYQKNNQSYILADIIQHHLDQLYKTKGEPMPGKTYYLLKQSICPTVIVEMGYLSNSRDRRFLVNEKTQIKIARTIQEAVSEYMLIMNQIQDQETWDVIEEPQKQHK